MLTLLLRSFTRALGRSLGYQAARRTGWLLWPALLGLLALVIAAQLGFVPAGWVEQALHLVR